MTRWEAPDRRSCVRRASVSVSRLARISLPRLTIVSAAIDRAPGFASIPAALASAAAQGEMERILLQFDQRLVDARLWVRR